MSSKFRRLLKRRRLSDQLDQAELVRELNTYDYQWDDFSVQTFVPWCEARLGRKIYFSDKLPLSAGLFGAFFRTERADWVFVANHLKGLHKLQATLHELSHALLGHPIGRWTREQVDAALGGDSSLLECKDAHILYRSANRPRIDAEAELLATLMIARIVPADASVSDQSLRDHLIAERDYLP